MKSQPIVSIDAFTRVGVIRGQVASVAWVQDQVIVSSTHAEGAPFWELIETLLDKSRPPRVLFSPSLRIVPWERPR